jgi:ketosteroid isomerase-like protein
MDVKGQDEPVPMVLRTTEVFRLEDGEWRLIHRHADITPGPKD